jgi:hypothetical protein
MRSSRLNAADRLAGDAEVVDVCRTIEPYILGFTVRSKNNQCAAADIQPHHRGRAIYGVLYQVPAFLIERSTARRRDRRSLDEIEAEGTNYIRQGVLLFDSNDAELAAVTYIVKDPRDGLRTSVDYVEHIFRGMEEHRLPEEYQRYVAARVVENNEALAEGLRVRGIRVSPDAA